MKHMKIPVVFLVMLAVGGCSLSYYRKTLNDGFDFPSENVNRIVKGKTTGDELIELFGGPLAKNDISETEEVWRYSYSAGVRIEEGGFFSDDVQSTRQYKVLVITLKNGTVADFTYIESH